MIVLADDRSIRGQNKRPLADSHPRLSWSVAPVDA
jgi:hypothetical protein